MAGWKRRRSAAAWRAALLLLVLAAGSADGDAPARPLEIDAIPEVAAPEVRLEEIRRRVQAAVSYPPAARERGITGVARIQFEIGSDGRAAGIETVQSSGSGLLDRAAEQGARDAGVLPQLWGRIRIPVRFALEAPRPGALP
jgi:protein TonB